MLHSTIDQMTTKSRLISSTKTGTVCLFSMLFVYVLFQLTTEVTTCYIQGREQGKQNEFSNL